PLLSLKAQIGQRLVILATHLAVDFQEPREQITGSGWIDLRNHFLEERIVDGQVAGPKFLRKHLEPKSRRDLGASRVFREYDRSRVARKIPRKREQRNSFIRTSLNREAAIGMIAQADAGFAPITGRRDQRHLRSALIDVVLESIGSDRGWPKDDFDIGR